MLLVVDIEVFIHSFLNADNKNEGSYVEEVEREIEPG